jgi:hypothetical protein
MKEIASSSFVFRKCFGIYISYMLSVPPFREVRRAFITA